jgi:CDP-6-deoxy-D-xylo-4-hexulose-3-dehydrase
VLKISDIFQSNNDFNAVIELTNNSVFSYPCKRHGSEFVIDKMEKQEWILSQITNYEVVGTLNNNELEKAKRQLIFEKVEEFHDLFHIKKSFEAGHSNLSYAGKVYDSDEMVALTDATLDFWLTSGRFSKTFEQEFAEFLGVRYALLTNSGSSANLLALSALTSPKLGNKRLLPGDEVITVAAGFPTTVAPIVQNKLIPVFVDVELGTYNIKVEQVEQAISPKTKAIMIAHTMGNPFKLDAILEIAKKYDLWVIEDNCDALGSKFDGKYTGTFGHIATSSFYPPHHITMGEGGAVYTNDPILKLAIESFRDWGRDCWCASGCDNTCKKRFGWQLGELPYGYDHKYTYSHLGYNLKVTDMQAAIGIKQLKKLPTFIERRIHNFNRLSEKLKPVANELILPFATENSQPSWFGYILTIRDSDKLSRNAVTEFLEKNKIQTRMLFAGNLIKQPAFDGVEYRLAAELINTDKVMNDTFLVGVYPGLSDEMIDYMAEKIIEAIYSLKK